MMMMQGILPALDPDAMLNLAISMSMQEGVCALKTVCVCICACLCLCACVFIARYAYLCSRLFTSVVNPIRYMTDYLWHYLHY